MFLVLDFLHPRRLLIYSQLVLFTVLCTFGLSQANGNSCDDGEIPICQYEVLESVNFCSHFTKQTCGTVWDENLDRYVFRCEHTSGQSCVHRVYQLTLWVTAEIDENRWNRIVFETDEFVRQAADELEQMCRDQENGESHNLDQERDCVQVIDQDYDALTAEVGRLPGIRKIGHEILNTAESRLVEGFTFGKTRGRRFFRRYADISLDVHELEFSEDVVNATFGSKMLGVTRVDAHERLHAQDWKIFGNFAGNAGSSEVRHDEIHAQDDKIGGLMGESPSNWNSQCGGPMGILLLWQYGWGHEIPHPGDIYCLVKKFLPIVL